MAFIYDSLYTDGILKLSWKKTMQLLNVEHEIKHDVSSAWINLAILEDNDLKVGLSSSKNKFAF